MTPPINHNFLLFCIQVDDFHWRKKYCWRNQNIRGGQKVAITDETTGVSQLFWARAQAAPTVYAYVRLADL